MLQPLKGTLVFMAAAIIIFMAFRPGFSQEVTKKAKSDPIRITADKLVADNQKRSAVFSGSVKAVQGNTVITTDRLTLYYTSQGEATPSSQADSIERMEALGHVRIEFDNKVAVSNQAVYIIAERKLILTGQESKVVSGQDEIVGSKITFYRDNGRVALEGDDQTRVKAIIHSDQRGLN